MEMPVVQSSWGTECKGDMLQKGLAAARPKSFVIL